MNGEQADRPRLNVERLTQYSGTDLDDLCEATESAIVEGGGFGWLKPPPRQVLENYWKGVLLVPERRLVVGRLDGIIAGSAQLTRAPRNNEAQAFAGTLAHLFVAPWARGHGLGRSIVLEIERLAREFGLAVLNLDLRDTQTAAIGLYESLGYRRWGTHPVYARVDRRIVPGHYYYKLLDDAPTLPSSASGGGLGRGDDSAAPP
jgi:ribosomal protein S18 acetylase RimI-like enzyme